ncbi:hypothetical protein D9M69_667680 [compost metagenome]
MDNTAGNTNRWTKLMGLLSGEKVKTGHEAPSGTSSRYYLRSALSILKGGDGKKA